MHITKCMFKKKYLLVVVLIIVVLFARSINGWLKAVFSDVFSKGGIKSASDIVIVLDAGHGGDDPGKVGVHGELEKDINLIITKKVKRQLEKTGVTVVLTRENEQAVYDGEGGNKKIADMRKRIDIISGNNATLTVSIHQNSFPSKNAKGAQVFYYKESPLSEKAGISIQNELVNGLDTSNNRKAKANASYYILKKSPCPAVIVECGFLSNEEEADKLTKEDYQEKVALCIARGVVSYLNDNLL